MIRIGWGSENAEAFRWFDVVEAGRARGEGLLALDISRMPGRLVAGQSERWAAKRCIAGRIERPPAQRARCLELDAALDLYELRAQHVRAPKRRAALNGLVERLTQGFARPELVPACASVWASR